MTTVNRTNEPTEAMVEAAAEGMWDRYGDRGMFQHAAEHLRSAFRKDARAALVAAAEVAPVVQQVSESDLAEVERAAAERALTEAAEDYEGYLVKPGLPIEDQPSPMARQYKSAAERLRKRAAALGLTAEQEGENDE